MDELLKHLRDILMIFAGSSLAGLANLLWEGEPIPRGRKVGAVLLSGSVGVIAWLLITERLADAPLLAAGISLLAGIGGATTLDFLSALLRKYVTTKLNLPDNHDGPN